ncbi:MAG TPA: sigma 54-interacting transcriptional regulator [Novimethylophilus sp.]|jgi:two-component system response regulator GlrR|uniref:sigma 54-interacting transcriptional regulator n=1 Tax=Novimethylophilus sp. TaxID=2137426 RepID=UPI002F401B31
MSPASPQILIVDDDPDLLKLLAMRLQAAGYTVASAASGEAALALVAAAKPGMVITDLRMGSMDGLSLFDALHKSDPALPVIILTAHGSIPDAVEATRRGVFGFLTKPFDSKELLRQVEAATSLASGASPTEARVGKSDEWRQAFVTRSPIMNALLDQAHMVAESDASIFIRGESGTGKEMLAQAIHRASPRRSKPFIAINCGAIPEPLLESELFGHTRGAFTGATRDHKGLCQAAEGGTLFLDEIGDMPQPLQVKLLRALQERKVRPVGATQSIDIDVRIISATHRDITAEMKAGNFREDLYYRLNVVSFEIPSLAERREDIPLLASYFLNLLCVKYHKEINGFAPEAMELLLGAPWPGNVRQLQNIVEQTAVLCTTPIIPTSLVQKALRDDIGSIVPFEEARRHFERDYLARLLKVTSGNVTQAARLAKRNRTEFYKLLQRHQLNASLFKEVTE